MEKILEELRKFTTDRLSYEVLGKFVKNISLNDCQLDGLLPPVDASGSYSRNILMMEPLEVALLHWPPQVESAVHHHKGFYGYVLVVQGACDNVEYILEGGMLRESITTRALAGGVLDEPDGVIHKIANPGETETLVTLHFYFPALETLDGLVLYDLKDKRMGVLNEKAQSASFIEPPNHFHVVKENAFSYESEKNTSNLRSHFMFPVVPKPESMVIRKMISAYYQEQARQYDHFDLQHESRSNYIQRINQLIAARIQEKGHVSQFLAIACGTGRRAVRIQELSTLHYPITCVDLSAEMCSQAADKGINAHHGAWMDVSVPDQYFDVVTFLYAFGHIPSAKERLASLKKIGAAMSSGGQLFFDVFNIRDQHEWGPMAVELYESRKLNDYGYERGDVFYKKRGGKAIAFLHYFEEQELVDLLEEAGFRLMQIDHIGYVVQSGQILEETDQGAFLIWAEKV